MKKKIFKLSDELILIFSIQRSEELNRSEQSHTAQGQKLGNPSFQHQPIMLNMC